MTPANDTVKENSKHSSINPVLWIGAGVIIAFFLIIFGIPFLVGSVRLFLARNKRYEKEFKIEWLKAGDIVLTGRKSIKQSPQIQLANVLTQKLDNRFWTHAAIYAGNNQLIEAQPEGIIKRDIRDYLTQGAYLRAFRHRYIQDPAIFSKILNCCASKVGRPYDFKGVIFYAFSILWPIGFDFLFDVPWIDKTFQVENSYFCSELLAESFEELGYPVFAYGGWRAKPSDFIGNPLFVAVEGE